MTNIKKPKVLFILKRRQDYSTDLINFTNLTVCTGMYNSAKFVCDMLNRNNIESHLEIVIDNNCIDRVVTLHKPTHVIIEGIQVIPDKFTILKKLHPSVKQIIRCHSEIPFIAQEGIAFKQIFDYLDNNIIVSCNSHRMQREILSLAKIKFGKDKQNIEDLVPLLYNYYPIVKKPNIKKTILPKGTINIGCFGAIRPMKNHLMQAVAAIEFAEKNNLILRFHINAGRIESNGSNSLKNVKSLFDHIPKHHLIEHQQTDHDSFIDLIKAMDVCLQVSFTETFNIVSADAVANYIPIVVSDEISQSTPPYANPVDSISIIKGLTYVLNNQKSVIINNVSNLNKYSLRSEDGQVGYFKEKNKKKDSFWDFFNIFKWF